MCSDSCGWLAALVAALAYGSYGVPIKATLDIDVHPFVLQSYKTVVLFVSSWFVLYIDPTALKFTPYGILSGVLWVSGGACGVYGIRNAGMAIAVGTWASVMVCVNFSWGILIFREPVHSFGESCFAFLLLLAGLVGMSKYSANSSTTSLTKANPRKNNKSLERSQSSSLDLERTANNSNNLVNRRETTTDTYDEQADDETVPMIRSSSTNSIKTSDGAGPQQESDKKLLKNASIFVGGFKMTPRESGIAMAALNGLLAGSSLVPLHYAKQQGFQNWSYILSFGMGSLIANLALWCLYILLQLLLQYQQQPDSNICKSTWDALPNFYFTQLWKRGLMAGILLSIGMFGSILATSALGQGVGNSLVQSKIVISGLWGICYYKEISNPKAIRMWFLSATLCVSGILLLSYERLAAMKELTETGEVIETEEGASRAVGDISNSITQSDGN